MVRPTDREHVARLTALLREVKRAERADLLAQQLTELGQGHDYEVNHHTADLLLLAYIDDAAVTDAFLALGRWYA